MMVTMILTQLPSLSRSCSPLTGDSWPAWMTLALSACTTQLRFTPCYASILAGLDISGDPRVGDLRTVVDKLAKLIEEGV